MSSDKRQEQQIQKEFDGQVRVIRNRLSDQLGCLDRRSEVEREVLQDFQEYFQSRCEIEKEYAKKLERLYENHAKKRRLQTPSRESDPQIPSTIACWNVLMDMTKSHQKHHQLLGSIYGDHLASRFSHLREVLEAVYRKSREMTVEVHMEILRVVNELFSALKSYHSAHSESKRAGNKFKQTEQNFSNKKGSTSQKSLEKQLEKSMGKFQECQLKATKSRNDYLLTLAATNTTLQKYFKQDILTLIDCLDLGYVTQMKKTLAAFHSAELDVQKLQTDNLKRLELHVKGLDANKDKDLFLCANPSQFEPPPSFLYQPHGGDEIFHVLAEHDTLYDELCTKYESSVARVSSLKTDTEEIKKSLDTVLATMRDDRINILMEDIGRLFQALKPKNNLHAPGTEITRSSSLRRKQTSVESEMYYLEKSKEYLQKANSQARIQARIELIQAALNIDSNHRRTVQQRSSDKSKPMMRKRPKSVFHAKLFGGNLQDYLSITKCYIPPVVESCIEFISLYGIEVEGIFRMPGSKTEINEMKAKFESGEDPLPDLGEKGDVHLVASVLKSYFRDLPEPLFPANATPDFMEASRINELDEKISKLKELVDSIPIPVMVVMRYLFEFLKALSSHSDENMMDSHNLAVCFGPTLLWTPEGEDPVTAQSSMIEVVDYCILFAHDIFPKTPGPHYKEGGDISPTGSLDTIPESTCDGDEEVPVTVGILAVAKDDYTAHTSEELSFKRGQKMVLHVRVDNFFWRGTIGDIEGLIPNSHVNIPELEERGTNSKVEMESFTPWSVSESGEAGSSPAPTTSGFNPDHINRLNTTLANQPTPPDIVQDLPTRPTHSPSTSKAAPPVKPKPKPMRPMPSVRRNIPPPSGNKSQTL